MSQQTITIQPGDSVTVNAAGGPVPPTITGINISGPATISENASAVFTDTVLGTGNFDKTVTWKASDGSITNQGVFTAPNKVENVTVTAISNGDPTKQSSVTVSISMPSNTVKIAPSGGDDDTAVLQTALNSTAAAGKILEMTLGTFKLSPVNLPTNTNLLIDSGVLLTDRAGYGGSSCMLNYAGDNVKVTAGGATLQMPISYAKSVSDGQQWRHGVSVRGNRKNAQISGLNCVGCGGDGFMFRECSNLVADKISASKNFRNGLSITGQVNGVLVSNSNFSNNTDKANAGIAAGCDVEGNVPGDYVIGVRFLNCVFNGNQQWGLYLTLWFLDSTSQHVSVDVTNCQATSNGTNYMWSDGGKSKVSHTFTGSGNTSNGQPISISQMFPGA